MGRLGWTEQQTLDTTMPAIELANKGRMKLIREVIETVFGNSGETTGEPVAEPLSPKSVQSVLRSAMGATK